MIISLSDIKHKLGIEYGIEVKICPVGAHYVHGKVKRKIQNIKRSLKKMVDKNRLSVLHWASKYLTVSIICLLDWEIKLNCSRILLF